MNLRQAEHLLAVYEEGSVSQAANRLGISQPAISQTIQMAEREIGMSIFRRGPHGRALTYAGEKYLATARQLIALEGSLDRELRELRGESQGKLRIGISVTRAMFLLPQVLPSFLERHQGVELELVEAGTSDLDFLLLDGRVDLAFLLSVEKIHPDLEYITLCRDQLLLIAGADTAIARSRAPGDTINIQEARDEAFISLLPGHGVRSLQDRIFYDNRMSPRILMETSSPEVARRLAIVCGAVALFPETLMPPEASDSSPAGVWFRVGGSHYLRDFFLCYPKNTFLPQYMQDFIAATRDYFRERYTRAIPD